MKKARSYWRFLTILLLVLVTGLGGTGVAVAAEAQRDVSLTTAYPDITIVKNQTVSLPILVTNRGEVDERLDIKVSTVPEGWVVDLLNNLSSSRYSVRGLYLTVDEGSLVVYFQAKPPAGAAVGEYVFVIEALSHDEIVQSSLQITVAITEQATVLSRVNLITEYPDLAGPSDSSFEFKVTLTNDSSDDRTYAFSAEAPPQWEIFFRPAFGDKIITSLGMKAGDSEDIKVDLFPPLYALPGTYSATIKATSGEVEGSAVITVTLLEKEVELTPDIEILSLTGRVDTEAIAGKETHFSILLTNRGSGKTEAINFYASKPEQWTVTFVPQRVPIMQPGESREIDIFIMPPSKAIAGDYMLTLRANALGVADTMDLRVAVGSSTVWGWLGLFIVLLVIAGMVTLFWRMGRR